MSSSEADRALWDVYTRDIVPLGKTSIAVKPSAIPLLVLPGPFGHTLDLHGLTVAKAHALTIEFLSETRSRYRHVTIITGISGGIRREFADWLRGFPISRIEELNGGGGFRIHFRRSR